MMNPYMFSNKPVILLLLIWILFWKGCALWFASKEEKKLWFWALLIINTLGILEIVYIFHFANKKWSDIEKLFGDGHPRSKKVDVAEVPKEE